MKPQCPIRAYCRILTMLAAASSFDALASSVHITPADMSLGRQASVPAVAYGVPALATQAAYVSPIVDQAPDRVNVSTVHEVEGWKLLVAVIGLIGMRLWCVGKKSLPVIG